MTSVPANHGAGVPRRATVIAPIAGLWSGRAGLIVNPYVLLLQPSLD
jgi:hypothetical protein